MQRTVSAIQWGSIPLVLDRHAFEEGYTHGRQYYFDDAWEEQEGSNETLTASHLLGLIAVNDGRSCYQLDDGQDKSAFRNGVEELLGVLVGYLSGPLHPETSEERARRQSECIVIED